MSSPEANPFSVDSSCSSACPPGQFGTIPSVPNDELSCQLCPRGKSSAAGSKSCDLKTVKLPNGNGKHLAADRVGDTLGRIVDDILGTDSSKKEIATKKYGPIENWDVSEVTNMKYAFWELRTFNGIISSWDTSSVTDMYSSTFKYIHLYKCS